jgi:hypothetical protein
MCASIRPVDRQADIFTAAEHVKERTRHMLRVSLYLDRQAKGERLSHHVCKITA